MKKRIIVLCMALLTALSAPGSIAAEETATEPVIIEDMEALEEGGIETETAEITETEISETETPETENSGTAGTGTVPGDTAGSDGFLVSVQEVETRDYTGIGDVLADSTVLTDEITISLDQAGMAETAGLPEISLFSNAGYVDSYGGQLDGDAKEVYDLMAEHFAENPVSDGEGGLSGFTYTLSEPFCFHLDMTTEDFSAGKYQTDPDYQEAAAQLKYVMQAAYDAILFDAPQLYYIKPPTISYRIQAKENEAGGIDVAVYNSELTIRAQESITNALSRRAEFQSVADAAVSAVRSRIASDADRETIVKTIHDYVCEIAVYDDNYKSYANGSEQYYMIHSAAGFFLDSNHKVVCDGYAKAFKILCDRFDVPCAIIPGMTTEGHAWNYVQMEDGNWYLVDTTWDDGSSIRWNYFLMGGMSKGASGEVLQEARTVYTNFSGAKYTMSFAAPQLNPVRYHEHSYEKQIYVSDYNATCMADGTKHLKCDVEECDARLESVPDVGSRIAHSFTNYETVTEASCTADGKKAAKCDYGCGTEDVVTEPKIAHSFIHYVSDGNATCVSDGTKTAACDYGCGQTQTVADVGSRIAHSFTNYVSDGNADWYQDGTKTAFCDYGCGQTQTVTDAGSAKIPTIKLNVSSIKLEKKQSTTAVKVTGLAPGDAVAKWKSSDTSIVKVTKSGKIKAKNKTGKAKVTVVLQSGLEKSITVKVQAKPVKTTSISEVPKKLTLKKGKKVKLSPVLAPVTSVEKITYTSSNPKVASVNAKGAIKAKKKGKTTITVRAGGVRVTCKVVVK